jgi:hypothetical protein
LKVSDPPNQLAKLQLSLLEESPPSPSEETTRRREEPHPARLFSSRLDSAKMKADIAPTATKKPAIAPFIENLPDPKSILRRTKRHGAATIGRHLWPRRSSIVQTSYGTFGRTESPRRKSLGRGLASESWHRSLGIVRKGLP